MCPLNISLITDHDAGLEGDVPPVEHSEVIRVFNENNEVARGIKEHYYPLVADAELATGAEGQIVGIADKLDTICAVFALNKIPSGSVDPLGVRRAAIGILQTIMQKKLNVNLPELIDFAISILGINIENPETYYNSSTRITYQC